MYLIVLLGLLASSFLLCSSAAINVPHHQYVLVIGNTNILNYSLMSDDPDGSDHRHLLMPIWAYQIASGYLFFISVMGLILNVIVIIVILNDPKKMTPLNWMLFNLAWSDGIIAGFGAPISAIAAFYSGWPFSQEFCSAYAMITSTAGIGSITTLSALAIYRCKLVVQKHVHPPNRISAFTNHSVRLGRRQASLLLALIWSYALIVTCPPLFGWGHYDREAAHISCSVDWQLKFDNNRSYVFYVFAMGLFVPTVVIVVSYSNILRVVRQVKREIRQRTSVLVKSTQKNRRSDAAEKRSTIMVAVMIGAFVVTWLPYSVLALIEFFNEKDDQTIPSSVWWSTLPCLLAKTAVVLNPIIYGFLNTQFRLAWENFSIKFLGRSGRFYNQGMIGGSSSNDHPQPRQLLVDFSPAAAAGPLTKILSRSSHLSSQHQKSSQQNVDCNPPAQEQENISNQQPSPSSSYSAAQVKSNNPLVTKETLDRNDEQNELPVSLEIVRYLPSNGDIHRICMLHASSTGDDVI